MLRLFQDLSFAEWRLEASRLGFGSGQTNKFFRAVHAQWPLAWQDLDAPSRQVKLVAAVFDLARLPTVKTRAEASDGTVKFLLELGDGRTVEAVHIPDSGRGTVCISSQVGCAIGCDFCFTAKMGLQRNMSPSEIVGQWVRIRRELADRPFTNLVFMGMGEPLHNIDNVLTAIDVFTHDFGLKVPARRITVSTSGLIPGLRKLLEASSVRVALSVNGPNAAKRRAVMPIEKAYPVAEVLDLLRARAVGNHHHVMFEYVLLGGVNDGDGDARDLLRLLEGVPGRVNLISFNPHPGSPYAKPERERVLGFHAVLRQGGRNVFIRDSRGQDVLAACGQLHAGHE